MEGEEGTRSCGLCGTGTELDWDAKGHSVSQLVPRAWQENQSEWRRGENLHPWKGWEILPPSEISMNSSRGGPVVLQDSSQTSTASGREGKGFKRILTANSGSVFPSCSVGIPTALPRSRNPLTVLCVPAQNSPAATEPPGTLPSLGTTFCAHPLCFWASEGAAVGRGHGQGSRAPMDHTRFPTERMERAGERCPARHGEEFAVSHNVPCPLACAGWCHCPHSPPATPQSRRGRRGWIAWNKPSILLFLFLFPRLILSSSQ